MYVQFATEEKKSEWGRNIHWPAPNRCHIYRHSSIRAWAFPSIVGSILSSRYQYFPCIGVTLHRHIGKNRRSAEVRGIRLKIRSSRVFDSVGRSTSCGFTQRHSPWGDKQWDKLPISNVEKVEYKGFDIDRPVFQLHKRMNIFIVLPWYEYLSLLIRKFWKPCSYSRKVLLLFGTAS